MTQQYTIQKYKKVGNSPKSALNLIDYLGNLAVSDDFSMFSPELNRLIEKINQTAFGFDEKKVEGDILVILYEYEYGLEIDNLIELTKIPEKMLLPVLNKLVAEGVVKTKGRRRWQEFGEHYNLIYYLMD